MYLLGLQECFSFGSCSWRVVVVASFAKWYKILQFITLMTYAGGTYQDTVAIFMLLTVVNSRRGCHPGKNLNAV